MTISEYREKIENAIDILSNDRERFFEQQLKGLIGIIRRRVFVEGTLVDGSPTGEYSTKDTLVGASSFRRPAVANSFFKSKNKWVKVKGKSLAVLPGGYKKIRQLEDNFTGHKVFNRTGDMWNSVEMRYTINNGRIIATIGPKGENNIKKMRVLEANHGEFFGLTDKQIEEIESDFSDYVQALIS